MRDDVCVCRVGRFASIHALLAALRLAKWDFSAVLGCLPTLLELLDACNAEEKLAVARGLAVAFQDALFIGEDDDIAFGACRVAFFSDMPPVFFIRPQRVSCMACHLRPLGWCCPFYRLWSVLLPDATPQARGCVAHVPCKRGATRPTPDHIFQYRPVPQRNKRVRSRGCLL